MAVICALRRWSGYLFIILTFTLIINNLKTLSTFEQEFRELMIGMKVDVRYYPSRNSGLPRSSSKATKIMCPIKMTAAIKLTNLTLYALYLVLLSGDINPNPGPTQYAIHTCKKGLKIGHLNVRSLLSKIDEVRLLMAPYPLDILCITESWLDESVLEHEINISGYSSVRKDRNRHGGGTAIFVKENIPFKIFDELNNFDLEAVWIEICITNSKPFLLGSVYRPPNDNNFFELYDDALKEIYNSNRETIVVGDFNCDYQASPASSSTRKLKYISNLYDFSQLVNTPTRITDHSNSLIDLIFSNSSRRIVECGVHHLGVSDHSMIYLVRKIGACKMEAKMVETRSYKNYDKNRFLADLAYVPWNIIDLFDDVNEQLHHFNKLFSDVCDDHAPLRMSRVKGNNNPWITSDIRKSMSTRDFYHKKFLKHKSAHYYKLFKNLRNQVNLECRKAKSNYYSKLINDNKGNPKDFWNAFKQLLPSKNFSHPIVLKVQDKFITGKKSIVSAFNNFFSTVGKSLAVHFNTVNIANEDQFNVAPYSISSPEGKFILHMVSEEDVESELSSLKTNKSAGMDKLNSKLLKDACSVITAPLTNIINLSISSGVYPTEWKLSKVIPIFKNGNRSDTNNYRPISILPVASKVMEKLVHKQFYLYLLDQELLTIHQAGFRPKYSTQIALVKLTDELLENLDRRKMSGLVFIDLCKAFDSIDHGILLHKLELMGIKDLELKWFKSYLEDRMQSVFVGGVYSNTMNIDYGVPQGSVLGPLLFSLYINDLPNSLQKCKIGMYADDTVIYVSDSSPSIIEESLNADLKHVVDWLNINKLTLNVKKTKFMIVHSHQSRSKPTDINIQFGDNVITTVTEFKYLGIILDQNMKWSKETDRICRTVSFKLSQLRRIQDSLDLNSRRTFYNAYILPLLDYGDIIWGDKLSNSTNMSKIQRLQNKAGKIILQLDMRTCTKSVLQSLKWCDLASRRDFHRAIFMFKSFNNLLPPELCSIHLPQSDVHHYNTRSKDNLRLPKPRTDWAKSTVRYLSTKVWNNLDKNLRSVGTLNNFKTFYKKIYFDL